MELEPLLPAGTVTTDPAELAAAAIDWWALALLRAARGDEPDLPAAVVRPASTDEVVTVLRWATETRTPVVARGGGSGVCGAAQPSAGAVVLDLSRLDRVLAVDEVSGAVAVEAGIVGARLEEELGRHGLTTGHYPQSIALSTVGGWIAAASAGQASSGYGAVEDLLLGATVVLADGAVARLRPVPRSAAGPDLRRLLVGSEGTLAVITEAVLSCVPAPAGWKWDAFRLPRFADAIELARRAVRGGVGATVLRCWDEIDSALAFGTLGHADGCAAIAGFPADSPGLDGRRAALAQLAGDVEPLEGYGERWWEHRNDAVGLYRSVMGPERSFGSGVVVDTLETAALWRDLPELHAAVGGALGHHAEAVACHLSHTYRSGASLYFTFLLRAEDDVAAERIYEAAWDEAAAACHAAGGTISHHHGVGRLKGRFLEAELGTNGLELLRRIRRAADPAGILNPPD